jgi:hypothetical protein
MFEELDGPAVSTLGVRMQKLSIVCKGRSSDQKKIMSRILLYFGGMLNHWSQLHFQPLAPIPFPRAVDGKQVAGRKWSNFYQNMMKTYCFEYSASHLAG